MYLRLALITSTHPRPPFQTTSSQGFVSASPPSSQLCSDQQLTQNSPEVRTNTGCSSRALKSKLFATDHTGAPRHAETGAGSTVGSINQPTREMSLDQCVPLCLDHTVKALRNRDSSTFSVLLYATLEEEVATHCSMLAWRIAWTEKPGGRQSTGSQRVKHD